MEFTLRLDPCTILRLGHNVSTPHTAGGGAFIGIVREYTPLSGMEPEPIQTHYEQIACLSTGEARALASMLMSLAQEARK